MEVAEGMLFHFLFPLSYVLFSNSEPPPKTQSTDICEPAWLILGVKTHCSFATQPHWASQSSRFLHICLRICHDSLELMQPRSPRILVSGEMYLSPLQPLCYLFSPSPTLLASITSYLYKFPEGRKCLLSQPPFQHPGQFSRASRDSPVVDYILHYIAFFVQPAPPTPDQPCQIQVRMHSLGHIHLHILREQSKGTADGWHHLQMWPIWFTSGI